MKRYVLAALTAFLLAAPLAFGDTPYNRVQIVEKTPVIDGTISAGEWPDEHMVRLSRFFHPEHAIRLYFSCDANYLYLGAYVEDGYLWADGNGGGTGGYWEPSADDSIEWYFDINLSRDTHLQDTDRMLCLNIGNLTDPQNGSGIVSRRMFNKGNGSGGSVFATSGAGVLPAGLTYKVNRFGTANRYSRTNETDDDGGWSIEVAVPWSALNRSAPANGDLMGINVRVISDDTGGTHDWNYYNNPQPFTCEYSRPVRPDEFVCLSPSWVTGSQPGLSGPANYQVAQFHRSGDSTPPGAVTGLAADRLRPYSAHLSWQCPGDNGSSGVAYGFDIRYATNLITSGNFDTSPRWPARIYPPAPGGTAETRILGLAPGTSYWFAVCARDTAGNRGNLQVVGPVATPTLAEAGILVPEANYKGGIFPAPGGRYFMREDGANFIPVGYGFSRSDVKTRYLYDAPVWQFGQMINWAQEPNALATFTSYVDSLAASGVTVMRLWLEDFFLPVQNDGVFSSANGAFWCEFPAGQFNPAMGQFLQTMLRVCAERGVYLLISPFETFLYDEYMNRMCWSTANGGPLTDINQFFLNSTVLDMCKARWAWVISQVNASGYGDAVFGYEMLNEYDSWEWSQAAANYDIEANYRAVFAADLASYMKSLAPDKLVMLSNAEWDPSAGKAVVEYFNDAFDAALPHLYMIGSREPWNNPMPYKGSQILQEHSRAVAWYTLNRLNSRPVLNGEWEPIDSLLPTAPVSTYSSRFTQTDDDNVSRIVWFTELCSGAAGTALRFPSAVFGNNGMLMDDYMLGVQRTLSNFVENGSRNPRFSFRDFPSQNWRGQVSIASITNVNTANPVLCACCSDGTQGLAYLLQDQNWSRGTISGAKLVLDGMTTAYRQFTAEFWATGTNVAAASYSVAGSSSGSRVTFSIPAFAGEWAVRFWSVTSLAKQGSARAADITPLSGRAATPSSFAWLDVSSDASYPWVKHPQLGWMYAVQYDDPQYFWFYTLDLGWMYTGPAIYPWMYSLDKGAWLFFLRDSNNPRWFYNAAVSQWQAL
jgi:hypothetical protein